MEPGAMQPVTEAAYVGTIPGLMEQALVPGLQIAIISNGRADVRSYGVSSVDTRLPVTGETVFEAASLSKQVFAYGVLRLAAAGRIDLDAPMSTYLPDLGGAAARLTARQLLTHRGGLPNSPAAGGGFQVEGEPGSRFSYSGEGFRLLQRAVERITGGPLQAYMKAAVFDPLGMTASSFVWRDDYAERKAFGHDHAGASAGRNRLTEANAASSLETTAADYARFLLAAVRGQGLPRELARLMLRPQAEVEQGCAVCIGRPRRPREESIQWGLGFGLAGTPRGRVVWHWGDNQTMQSYAAITSDGARGVVILTNSANGHLIAREIASAVLGTDAPGYAWVDSYGSYRDPAPRLLAKIVRSGVAALTDADLDLPRPELALAARRLLTARRPREAAGLMARVIAGGGASADELAILADALRRDRRFDEAAEAAAAALRLQSGHAHAGRVVEQIAQARRVIDQRRLARFAGRYASPFGPLDINSDGTQLFARLTDQPPDDMLPLSDTSFLMERAGVPIEFFEGPDGAVTHAVVRAGQEFRLPRIAAPEVR
jgi:CubicO group peptidase (beta-lactamase class C family)